MKHGKKEHGKWLKTLYKYDLWPCSECGECVEMEDVPAYRFCPWCGTPMDQEDEDEKQADMQRVWDSDFAGYDYKSTEEGKNEKDLDTGGGQTEKVL